MQSHFSRNFYLKNLFQGYHKKFENDIGSGISWQHLGFCLQFSQFPGLKEKKSWKTFKRRRQNDEIWQARETRSPSSTCATNMAALLRYGAARACRLLISYTIRNLSIYQRSSPALYQDNILKACLPSVNSSRCLANETLVNEASENQTAEVEAAAANIKGDSKIVRQKTGSRLGHYNYERNVRQLGTIFTRQLLLRTFNEILNRGKWESLQA